VGKHAPFYFRTGVMAIMSMISTVPDRTVNPQRRVLDFADWVVNEVMQGTPIVSCTFTLDKIEDLMLAQSLFPGNVFAKNQVYLKEGNCISSKKKD